MAETDKLAALLARCKCGVSIRINDHRSLYETAEAKLKEMDADDCPPEIEADVRAQMIATDTIIEIQFYPDTPVGFYTVFHYDLDASLTEALACLSDQDRG